MRDICALEHPCLTVGRMAHAATELLALLLHIDRAQKVIELIPETLPTANSR